MYKNISIVVADFDNKFDFITSALIKSINEVYPSIKPLIIGREIKSKNEELVNYLKENYTQAKTSPGSLRNILWNDGLQMAETDWVMFLDADMLLMKKIDNYIKIVEEKQAEFIFTWRPSMPYWINMGFLLIKKNDKTVEFFDELVKQQIENVKLNIGAGQYTFQKMLNRNKKEINEITTCNDIDKIFYFQERKINFAGISCKKLNNIYHTDEITNDVHVIHYKGPLGTILLRDKKENRYENLLKWGLFGNSLNEVKKMNIRLNVWKSYSDLNDKDLPIDIYLHYKRKIYKRYFFLLTKLIKTFLRPILRFGSNFFISLKT